MADIQIIAGSQLGTAFQLADDMAEALTSAGHNATVNRMACAEDLAGNAEQALLYCTSTTGFGELPNNLRTLEGQLHTAPPNVAGRRYGVIALGDSCYDFFCGAGNLIDNLMADIGAVRHGDILQIDAQQTLTPETIAVPWAIEWAGTL